MLKEKLKIGIDLDDVVFEFVRYLLEYLEKKFKIRMEFNEIISYKFSDVLDFSDDKVLNIIEKMILDSRNLEYKLCIGAVENIKRIAKNNEIFFITSRVYIDGTEESLQKIFLDIDYKIFFSSNPYVKSQGKNKGEICKELGIDYMIEDSYEYVLKCLDNGINCFLINKPWNINSGDDERIKRVNSWDEILNLLEKKNVR